MSDGTQLYRSTGATLLRVAVTPLSELPLWWPNLDEVSDCVVWLRHTWARPGFAAAVTAASPALARRVEQLTGSGADTDSRRVRRATSAVVRYVLRSAGRPTPFGLFAGVAPVTLGSHTQVEWGTGHRALARVDSEWLTDVIDRLKACPRLLARLDVVFSDLACERGGRLELANGPFRVSVRATRAVFTAWETASVPIRFGALAENLSEAFTRADSTRIDAMLTDLVRRGLLISSLRAPTTVTDPLARLLDELRRVHADDVAEAVPLIESDGVCTDEVPTQVGVSRTAPVSSRMERWRGAMGAGEATWAQSPIAPLVRGVGEHVADREQMRGHRHLAVSVG
ncbi:lantibiotic dehydratase [Embleya sp. MST-111070]|uniref:lantibiotic dehydratase n=1 Tax=Embleya sp. MST-111070 TaxID=3398231 RepID=UPI003F734135